IERAMRMVGDDDGRALPGDPSQARIGDESRNVKHRQRARCERTRGEFLRVLVGRAKGIDLKRSFEKGSRDRQGRATEGRVGKAVSLKGIARHGLARLDSAA